MIRESRSMQRKRICDWQVQKHGFSSSWSWNRFEPSIDTFKPVDKVSLFWFCISWISFFLQQSLNWYPKVNRFVFPSIHRYFRQSLSILKSIEIISILIRWHSHHWMVIRLSYWRAEVIYTFKHRFHYYLLINDVFVWIQRQQQSVGSSSSIDRISPYTISAQNVASDVVMAVAVRFTSLVKQFVNVQRIRRVLIVNMVKGYLLVFSSDSQLYVLVDVFV